MKLLKTHPLFSLLNSYLIDSPQPVNISYLWSFGSLLGVCLVIQIITGITSMIDIWLYNYIEINLENIEFFKGTVVSCATPFFVFFKTKKNNLVTLLQKYVNSFDVIKGLKHTSSFPLLPLKLANYHKSLLGRMFRVWGGLSAFALLTSKSEFALWQNHDSLFYYLIAIFGLSHLFYMLTIFTIKLGYVIYHIIKGDWLHRNSPLKYLMSESSGALFCIKGICYTSGIWFTAAGISTGLDEIIGEDFF
ncbi:MAG: hypothetical protein EOP34_08125 [Rickettsiales bacterium]|nr:MAG: hypothetical protein EOP34_08125 [Rickettsiales bacterium]